MLTMGRRGLRDGQSAPCPLGCGAVAFGGVLPRRRPPCRSTKAWPEKTAAEADAAAASTVAAAMAAASAGRLAGGVLAAMAHVEDATCGTSRARGQCQPEPLRGGGGDGRRVCGEVGGRCLGGHGARRGRDLRDVPRARPTPVGATPCAARRKRPGRRGSCRARPVGWYGSSTRSCTNRCLAVGPYAFEV